MGDRYILDVICPHCDHTNKDVYYAPTCDFITCICSNCGYEIDLETYTGITEADASNKKDIQNIIDRFIR
jgi:hypothetical protein